jgi:hypothetical protein
MSQTYMIQQTISQCPFQLTTPISGICMSGTKRAGCSLLTLKATFGERSESIRAGPKAGVTSVAQYCNSSAFPSFSRMGTASLVRPPVPHPTSIARNPACAQHVSSLLASQGQWKRRAIRSTPWEQVNFLPGPIFSSTTPNRVERTVVLKDLQAGSIWYMCSCSGCWTMAWRGLCMDRTKVSSRILVRAPLCLTMDDSSITVKLPMHTPPCSCAQCRELKYREPGVQSSALGH